ncbi:MAG: excinuclease ABC subunit UvrA [Candidatus Aureabacteria bacterium]|nr:excinuclease ABC subunit UvrA [Candidatus Auribacterota bacterium]
MKDIKITCARKHNLKGISLIVPKNKIVGMTGVSGSGKSTLAVDTIYAEGQRRYMESLSTYAKQFLRQVESSEVESIENIAPCISVTGQAGGFNARSTVGTMTEIDDFLRLLFAKISDVRCAKCSKIVKRHSLDEVEDDILKRFANKKVLVGVDLKDLAGNPEGLDKTLLELAGFRRVTSGSKLLSLSEASEKMIRSRRGMAVIDRVFVSPDNRSRISRCLELGRKASRNEIITVMGPEMRDLRFSLKNNCPFCRTEYQLPDIHVFSFNSALGACPECSGFGRVIRIDRSKVIPDENMSLQERAIVPFSKGAYRWWQYALNSACRKMSIPQDVPYAKLKEEQKRIIWEGTKGYRGLSGFFRKLEKKKYKVQNRVLLARYRKYDVCEKCQGDRLRKEALSYLIGGETLPSLQNRQLDILLRFFRTLQLTPYQARIAGHVLEEIISRLEFMNNVGLHYLHLMRLSRTLSGGELRRIQLAQGIGRTLCDIVYVLDEPTIGLHVKDTGQLIKALKNLKKLGNTIIVIEHDQSIIEECDHVIDLGPYAGFHGGQVVYQGDYKGLLKSRISLTGQYFSRRKRIPPGTATGKKKQKEENLVVFVARENNLKGITVQFPLNSFVAVTGVSGAGKSTLVRDILYKTFQKERKKELITPGESQGVSGFEKVEDMFFLDQKRIASTPKGNVATFCGVMTKIRQAFASTHDARKKCMSPGHFSFNSPKGQCPKCRGIGHEIIDMQFLTDVSVPCKFCNGMRYKSDVLQIHFNGKSIHEVLKLTIEEARDFFEKDGMTIKELDWLGRFGLGYVCLGQTLDTLSAGESQRLKLSDIVGKTKQKSGNVYIFDEPSVGLHLHDLTSIMGCLNRIKEEGNTVIVVEHNLEIIKNADMIIDLGPGGGEDGGHVVALGAPEEIAKNTASVTGQALKKFYERTVN